MGEFGITLFRTESLSIKAVLIVLYLKNTLKPFAKRLWLNFTLN